MYHQRMGLFFNLPRGGYYPFYSPSCVFSPYTIKYNQNRMDVMRHIRSVRKYDDSPAALCILLDMDGTMIGNISPAVCEYDIIRTLEPKKLNVLRKELVSRLKYGPVRPHLEAFCKRVAAHGVHLFVYTASEDQWAKFLIPCIEKAIGFTFHRPYFTRSNCHMLPNGDFRKSIENVAGIIFKKVKHDGNGVPLSVTELKERTILIDNHPDILLSKMEEKRLVTCPTYNYWYVYDVLSNLSIETLHARFHRASAIMKRYGMLPQDADASHMTFQQFMSKYYGHLSMLMKHSYSENVNGLKHDRWWHHLQDRLAFLPVRSDKI